MVAGSAVFARPHHSFDRFIFRLPSLPDSGSLPPGFLLLQLQDDSWAAFFLGRNAERLYRTGRQFGKRSSFLTWARRDAPNCNSVTDTSLLLEAAAAELERAAGDGDRLPGPRQVSSNQDLAQVLAGAVPTAFHELESEANPSAFLTLLGDFQPSDMDRQRMDFELYLNEAVDNWSPFRDGLATNPFLQAFDTRNPTPLPDLNEGNPLILALSFRTGIPKVLDEVYTDPGVVKAVTTNDIPLELRPRALEAAALARLSTRSLREWGIPLIGPGSITGPTVAAAMERIYRVRIAPRVNDFARRQLEKMKEDRSKSLAQFQKEFQDVAAVAGPMPRTRPVEAYISAVEGESDKTDLRREVRVWMARNEYPSLTDIMRYHMDSSPPERVMAEQGDQTTSVRAINGERKLPPQPPTSDLKALGEVLIAALSAAAPKAKAGRKRQRSADGESSERPFCEACRKARRAHRHWPEECWFRESGPRAKPKQSTKPAGQPFRDSGPQEPPPEPKGEETGGPIPPVRN